MAVFDRLPIELIQPILCQLDDRRDLTAAALVCWSFNDAATPLIYRTIDAHIKDNIVVSHPSTTLLRRRELARYVWHVTETGAALRSNPCMAEDIIAALRLCTNLVSATWVDYDEAAETVFMPILEILMTLPLKELTIRTKYDVGDRAWALLDSKTGICRLSVWSLEWAKSRVLQGWAERLGPTLTHLQLGRCAGVPPAILISVFSQLPLLQDLRVKGVQSAAMPSIMACLPNLIALDTEFQRHGNYHLPSTPLPRLQRLTIRTSSVDVFGPDQLWNWTCSLIPYEGSLQSFSLGSFAVQGRIAIPQSFVTRLLRRHGKSLVQFIVGIAEITPDSLIYLCLDCPSLESLECSVASADMETIAKATEPAKNLRALQLYVLWTQAGIIHTTPRVFYSQNTMYGDYSYPNKTVAFSVEEARTLMLRDGSKLRAITLGDVSYSGRWVRATPERDPGSRCEDDLVFEVVKDNRYTRVL
ncbi:hypothetical protein J3A83DRAFT_4356105 [Scleroderma citrinum]